MFPDLSCLSVIAVGLGVVQHLQWLTEGQAQVEVLGFAHFGFFSSLICDVQSGCGVLFLPVISLHHAQPQLNDFSA